MSVGKLRHFLSSHGRLLLALGGVIVIAALIQRIGPRQVATTIWGAGVWLPLILVLDFGWMALEGMAVFLLLGDARKEISARDWWKATFLHYATFVVVPMSRTSAEVARAGALSPLVGKSRAAAGAALMQTLTLSTNGLMSALCLVAVFLTTRHRTLTALLTVNIFATGALGLVLYLLLRHVKVGGFLGNRFRRLSQFGPEIDGYVRESKSLHPSALGFCLLGRLVQTVQYGVIVYAIVGTFSASSALTAEGIQLVGRSMGDAVPGQVGVTEGAFALCAGALSLATEPAKAISIALLGRASNLTVAGLCALGLQFLPRARKGAQLS